MSAYAKCTIKTSFFVNDNEDFNEIARGIADLLKQHPKIDRLTIHANVGFEYVAYYDEEEGQDA